MSWKVVWTRPAAEDMRRLGHTVARRIREAVLRLAESGQGDVKRLQWHEGELRLRAGKWRIRFTFDYEEQASKVLRVPPRGSAYRE
jgi:mRNA-degrading endonuclease RelE of RelBE toxin-antitoxin system